MKIIVDSGSSKSIWKCIPDSGPTQEYKLFGINPFVHDLSGFPDKIKKIIPEEVVQATRQIYFYGSGCKNSGIKEVDKLLISLFPKANKIEVYSDLLGAARAIFGTDKGIISILGTGSNIAYYNGDTLHHNFPSLGYLLGDEGGGFQIGKTILQDFFYNRLSSDLSEIFRSQFQPGPDFLKELYESPRPNESIANFSKFLNYSGESYRHQVLTEVFQKFIDSQVLPYWNKYNLPVGFCGSIASHFKDMLMETCHSHQITVSDIIKDPIRRLLAFHS